MTYGSLQLQLLTGCQIIRAWHQIIRAWRQILWAVPTLQLLILTVRAGSPLISDYLPKYSKPAPAQLARINFVYLYKWVEVDCGCKTRLVAGKGASMGACR